MNLNEQIALIARETGWTLEYIRSQPFMQLNALTAEILNQQDIENYNRLYSAALIVCTLASGKSHTYKPVEIIGERPERRVMAQNNLAKPAKLGKITLADGKEYELATLDANIMADLEDKFDKTIDELFSGPVRMKVFRALIYARLHPNFPDMTEEQIGALLTDQVIINMKKTMGV